MTETREIKSEHLYGTTPKERARVILWLRGIKALRAIIPQREGRIGDLRQIASLPVIDPSRERVRSGAIASPTENLALRLAAEEERLDRLRDKLQRATLRLMDMLDLLEDPSRQQLLWRIYVDGETVAQLAEAEDCSESCIKKRRVAALDQLIAAGAFRFLGKGSDREA